MKRAMAVLMVAGCGGAQWPIDGARDAGGDAGAWVDAGGNCDANAVAICDLAEATLSSCCPGVNEWRPVGGAALCGRIAEGDGNPEAACKQLHAMGCAQIQAAQWPCF